MKACVVLIIAVLVVPLSGEVPPMMNYQGRLTDVSGDPVPDSNYTMVFTIYRDSTGSVQIWTETQEGVPVQDGFFTVLLGSVNPIPRDVFGKIRWLGVQIPPDPEFDPLMPIVSVGNAFYSTYADTAVYSVHSSPDGDWEIEGDTVYRLTGRVGIGTSNPRAKLEVAPSDSYGVFIGNADFAGLRIGNQSRYGIYVDSVNWYGLRIESAGFNGILIDSAGYDGYGVVKAGDHGFHVYKANQNGLLVDTAGWYGLRVKYTHWDGVYVDSARDDGITLMGVGDDGLYIKNAGDHGINIENASTGILLDSITGDGVRISHAESLGLYVEDCYMGVKVSNAQNWGIHLDQPAAGILIEEPQGEGIGILNAQTGINIHYTEGNAIEAHSSGGIGGRFENYVDTIPTLWVQKWYAGPGHILAIFSSGMYEVADFIFYTDGNAYADGGWYTMKKSSKGEYEAFSSVQAERQELIAHGTGKLADGIAHIRFSSSFSEFLTEEEPVEITVTPVGSYSGLYIAERSREGFTVKSGAGDPNCEFTWIAIGVERGKETRERPANVEKIGRKGGMVRNQMFKEMEQRRAPSKETTGEMMPVPGVEETGRNIEMGRAEKGLKEKKEHDLGEVGPGK